MRFMKGGAFSAILLLLGLASEASSTTVLNIPGPTGGFYMLAGGALADSWTQNFSLADASIGVRVQSAISEAVTMDFYVTTQIGPTATLSDLVAFTSMDFPADSVSVDQTITPFSNLNLSPGTYYLVLADYNLPYNQYDYSAWNYNVNNGQTVPGLVVNSIQAASSLSTFAPASTFTDVPGYYGVMSLSGTVVQSTPTPEPSSLLLLALPLTVFGVARKRIHALEALDR